jgi:hypothetical protein
MSKSQRGIPVRAAQNLEAEIILNTWYVTDETGAIYSLRAQMYVGAGTDEEKLAFLRSRAELDYLVATPFAVPESFHTRVVEVDPAGESSERQVPVAIIGVLELLGGPIVLFEEAFRELERRLPAQTPLSIGSSPLVCLTPLFADENGRMRPHYTSRTRFPHPDGT